MTAPYLLTVSGTRIDLLNPRPEDVALPDIAHALARICRYTGHVRAEHYSVAQHSVHVAELLRDQGHSIGIQIQGLLHDAHEAFTGDMASPIKRALDALDASPRARGAWREFERRHEVAVRARFGLPADLSRAVHAADLAMLMAERRDLMPPETNDAGGWPDVEPAATRIYPMHASFAALAFMITAERLGVV